MTQQYTPAQLEAWAGLGPWCQPDGPEYGVMLDRVPSRPIHSFLGQPIFDKQPHDDWFEQEMANAALIAAAPDLARLVLEKEKEIARLRSEVRLCHMQVESAYKELGRATAKVKAWEEIVCLDPSSDPFKVVMSDDWVEQEQVKVQIPSVEKLTTLLNELAAARQAMKETSDE